MGCNDVSVHGWEDTWHWINATYHSNSDMPMLCLFHLLHHLTVTQISFHVAYEIKT